ncbi:hypothetical protein AVEN_123409-1 [Araneus ventricosus]|uniref:Uncharacterized protein n=1 Tax=Araneus ventricosus TaxID=182803 RepID=A0A4Y2R3M8_ARAVE|nr:hypothetical protein AVEN_123409-1 [Araneus ventricosus]
MSWLITLQNCFFSQRPDMSATALILMKKKFVKEFLMNRSGTHENYHWQTYKILPSANLDLLISNKLCHLSVSTMDLFSISVQVQDFENPDCLCSGRHGDVDHYLTSCNIPGLCLLLPTGTAQTHWTKSL